MALHKYDPPDLVTNQIEATTVSTEKKPQKAAAAAASTTTPTKKTASKPSDNSPVDFGGTDNESAASPAVDFEDTTPVSLASPGLKETSGSPLFESTSRNALDFDDGEDDSDDDLL